MSRRQNYITIPVDYIRELKRSKKRKKARAFAEYFDDMDQGEYNAERFYAQSWDISPSTAHAWLIEFKREIDKFFNFWILKNDQHYSHVQNQAEQKPSKPSSYQDDKQRVYDIPAEQQPREVFNNITTTRGVEFLDNNFMRLINQLKSKFKRVGNTEDSYKAYIKVKDKIDIEDIISSYSKYVSETKDVRRVGLAKFLNQLIYLGYTKPLIKVIKDDNTTITGVFYIEKEQLILKDRSVAKLKEDRYNELLAANRIEVLRYVYQEDSK